MSTAAQGGARRHAVVGSPIEHSLTPLLQGAAARALGLDWACERRLVARGELAGFLDALDRSWLGLSVTAPLKEEARAIAREVDARAALTGAVNTLLLDATRGPRGWNTDVGGIVRAFAESGLAAAETGAIVGAGATAQSALLALHELGARRVRVALRSETKGRRIADLGDRIGVEVQLQGLDEPLPAVDAAVSTLPAGADVVPVFAHPPARLLDADYARPAGSRFVDQPAEQRIDGREMLLEQAVLQARIFALGAIDAALPDELGVVAAMRASLELAPRADASGAVVRSASAGLEES
ncbi:shikimate dehydrogenase [Agrococcus sp. 1P02AA]|uniref:shikimate dehydrogenase family protein n=1 Tax=Agrococcus sp. 1P02AA TaxID=3132259 RepID=UPI0039A567F2